MRWAGGKTWFTKHLEKYMPNSFENYYEPFLGGGSIFFYLKSRGYIKKKAYLSDSNSELINTYKVLKSQPNHLFLLLKDHFNHRDEYYRMRDAEFDDPVEKAARFLYLNKTSFNGIYRVNLKGKYNVPYGRRNLDPIYDFGHLSQVSNALKKTHLSTLDFKKRCLNIGANDMVFIDPPYTVAHENNGFVKYNQSIFSWENQLQLSKLTAKLDERGAFFIVTNAYHDSIKQVYSTGQQFKLSRASNIGGTGAERRKYKEIIITNTVQ